MDTTPNILGIDIGSVSISIAEMSTDKKVIKTAYDFHCGKISESLRKLLNQFDLKPGIDRARFDTAWAPFIAHLVETDLAVDAGPLMTRYPDSGFDTDTDRAQSLLALIRFRDHAQANAAWAAIEQEVQPLARLHCTVFALVHDAVFTFWED